MIRSVSTTTSTRKRRCNTVVVPAAKVQKTTARTPRPRLQGPLYLRVGIALCFGRSKRASLNPQCRIAWLPNELLKYILDLAVQPERYDASYKIPVPDGVPRGSTFIIKKEWNASGIFQESSTCVWFFAREEKRTKTTITVRALVPVFKKGVDGRLLSSPGAEIPGANATIREGGHVLVSNKAKSLLAGYGCGVPSESYSLEWELLPSDNLTHSECIMSYNNYD